MATVIWLLRRHHFTRGRLGFQLVSDELAADFITKGWAQPAKGERLKPFDVNWPEDTRQLVQQQILRGQLSPAEARSAVGLVAIGGDDAPDKPAPAPEPDKPAQPTPGTPAPAPVPNAQPDAAPGEGLPIETAKRRGRPRKAA